MENTIENAKAFIDKFADKPSNGMLYDLLYTYAASITPSPDRNSIEQKQYTRTKIAEALDRNEETRPNRIVVPSEEEIIEELRANEKRMDDGEGYCHNPSFGGGARWLIESIRTLNAGARIVMPSEYEAVQVVRDNDAHWYIIPNWLMLDFMVWVDQDTESDDFDPEQYDQYRTGGDINNIQLYKKYV